MKGRIRTCAICGEKVIASAMNIGAWSVHIFGKHADTPEIKRIMELNTEIDNLKAKFVKDSAFYSNKTEMDAILKEAK